ncbi:prepilin-type N-terminal cleavage/methylation domain-containing protein [Alteromonas sp. 345S023]|uniref:Prepilin-type N-terminal cleavage/methylation domain-containing protein n=1 Tax=Alteromonas profundi TaxID=2696062 RepID=A0A7X5LNH4_9ALTE|nr:prepilin-type N-terminal cleavage/methylation domain-containing protein [Alteromonas profundi]NDV92179.1 prepilin-type N-terminal cleavage/methylation domain-containing protein [Alteromonas profundi]
MLSKTGFSLTELIVALAIGAAVILFATSSVLSLAHSLNTLNQRLVLESELRLLTQTISLQLSRAGYLAETGETHNNGSLSLLTAPAPAILIDKHPTGAPDSCVLFAYDKNHDGKISLAAPSEMLGFRLRDKALEYRVAGKSCSQSGWHDLTDSKKMVVSAFTLSPVYHSLSEQVIQVYLAVHTTHNPALKSTSSIVIKVNNAY